MGQKEDIDALAALIADYRQGQVPAATPAHVQKWLGQFPGAVQEPLIGATRAVLEKTYIPKVKFEQFLGGLLAKGKFAGDDPKLFWRNTKVLDVQLGGRSQKEMLGMLDGIMKNQLGLGIADGGKDGSSFVYIDDGIYTGNRMLNDLKGWVAKSAPKNANVRVVCMALHRGGQFYAAGKLAEAAKAAGKAIEFSWWRILELEDRKAYVANSDVLRPASMPNDKRSQDYAASLKFPVVYRPGNSVGEHALFPSAEARDLLEQQFLIAGALIREKCPNLSKFQRPLGNVLLEMLGFGSTIVTFRNCPNNAPLAFWAGNPWYPLFPRRTN